MKFKLKLDFSCRKIQRTHALYSPSHIVLQMMIEVPYIFIQTIIYGAIVYAMMGFDWIAAKFLWYLFFMYFTLLYFTFYGMMTMALTPNHNIAAITSSTFYAIWNLFSGFVVPPTVSLYIHVHAYAHTYILACLRCNLTKFWLSQRIPIWWKWYYWVCPVAWTLYGMVASQFGDVKEKLESGESVEHFLRSYFGYKHEFLGIVAVVIVAFSLLFGFIFAYAIRSFNFQKR